MISIKGCGRRAQAHRARALVLSKAFKMSSQTTEGFIKSAVRPVRMGLDDKFQFHCHPGVACFNACCKSIDITLTPYDILHLKHRLGVSSTEFLVRHTTRFDMDAHGVPGVKLDHKPNSKVCQFLTEEGCGVYEARPSACRDYALGTVSMRRKGAANEEDFHFVVKEDHCLGHTSPRCKRCANTDMSRVWITATSSIQSGVRSSLRNALAGRP